MSQSAKSFIAKFVPATEPLDGSDYESFDFTPPSKAKTGGIEWADLDDGSIVTDDAGTEDNATATPPADHIEIAFEGPTNADDGADSTDDGSAAGDEELAAQVIMGTSGDDVIYSAEGKTLIYGDAGNDEIHVTTAFDLVAAGEGDDTVDAATSGLIQLGAGNDVVHLEQVGATVMGEDGDDTLAVTGAHTDYFFVVGMGDDGTPSGVTMYDRQGIFAQVDGVEHITFGDGVTWNLLEQIPQTDWSANTPYAVTVVDGQVQLEVNSEILDAYTDPVVVADPSDGVPQDEDNGSPESDASQDQDQQTATVPEPVQPQDIPGFLYHYWGTDADDTFNATEGQQADVRGGGGNDYLTSTTDYVNFSGGAGNDTFALQATVQEPGKYYGTHGNFDGGEGYDTLDLSSWSNLKLIGNFGLGVGLFGDAYKVIVYDPVMKYTSLNLTNVEAIKLADGSIIGLDTPHEQGVPDVNEFQTGGDGTTFYGTFADDSVQDTAGNQTIYGGGGNDRINSQWGKDALIGGDGDDSMSAQNSSRLSGEDGDDELIVYAGGDLTGGNGRDTFSIHVTGAGQTVIHDFNANEDHIALHGDDAGKGLTVQQSGSNAVVTALANDGGYHIVTVENASAKAVLDDILENMF